MASAQNTKKSLDSFKTESTFEVGGKKYRYYSVNKFAAASGLPIASLPFSLKILLENLLRNEDNLSVKKTDVEKIAKWDAKSEPTEEIQFMPARVVLQDFTGVPCVADLAAMRTAITNLGGNAEQINPLQPVDLVIDHSVMVDHFGRKDAEELNAKLEYERNGERYQFLRWGQNAFQNFRVVPPDTGIIHQVNVEYLSHVAMVNGDLVYPDTMVGTDSHTTMINGLGCLGWGVGGIEAEAAMLGQPCSMLIPQVVGFKLKGKTNDGVTATDLVLTVTQMLRKKGVVGKFVEFFGPGLSSLTLADRATIANMAPEYGATVGLFPVDEKTVEYLALTNRAVQGELVKAYYQAQGLWYDANQPDSNYSDTLELDLSTVEPSLAGPARPQDRINLGNVPQTFSKYSLELAKGDLTKVNKSMEVPGDAVNKGYSVKDGAVVIAAITSCTNTSNPSVLISAGLVAKNAVARGLKVQPWVKTSLAPGSKVVTDYLQESGLLADLEKLNFHVVGYGCTTCIGNSGPLPEGVSKAVADGDLTVASVLSGNRNFEGRVNPQVKANFLASPPLCVAYAIAGTVNLDLTKDPLGTGSDGKPVYLKDIWPTDAQIAEIAKKHVTQAQFKKSYADVFTGTTAWSSLQVPTGNRYAFQNDSTYIKEPPFFDGMSMTPAPIKDIHAARVLCLLGDSITTDHISPAGSFNAKSPAGQYLSSLGVAPVDFNSYGSRRGNHEVMVRGTFANVRLKNLLVPGVEGGVTRYHPDGTTQSIYDASMKYQASGTPLVVIAGKEYGTGSSRDWAAKGPKLLGISVVIAESFERIHRSNLIGMGILPLQFMPGESAKTLSLNGEEAFDFVGLTNLACGQVLKVKATCKDSPNCTVEEKTFEVKVRIDTPNELEYYKHGGILLYVLRNQAAKN